MRIEAIAIHNFKPFQTQKCIFGRGSREPADDVHVFVGENGTGKTRLLSMLMAACGNAAELNDRASSPHAASVILTIKEGAFSWASQFQNAYMPIQLSSMGTILDGYLAKGNASHSTHQIPISDANAMAFRSVAAIREERSKPLAAVSWKEREVLTFARNESVQLNQAIINMKIRAGIFLAGQPAERKDRNISIAERLEKTLESISGKPFVFLVEQDGDNVYLRVKWGNVRIQLHQLPDGLRTIIGWLAACVSRLDHHLRDVEDPLAHPTIIIVDEPETHLHPAWQRRLIPALKLLLPNAQIFLATHSPFVVSSVNAGWIYILRAEEGNGVRIAEPVRCSKGDTYIDIVEDILGIKEWYDPETEGMLSKFRELRNAAYLSLSESDIAAMEQSAKAIAERSESLSVMMGRELAQFRWKRDQSKKS